MCTFAGVGAGDISLLHVLNEDMKCKYKNIMCRNITPWNNIYPSFKI